MVQQVGVDMVCVLGGDSRRFSSLVLRGANRALMLQVAVGVELVGSVVSA